VKDGTNLLSGVTVALNGVPFSLYSSQSGADGRFTLSRVPLLPLNFSALRPGYTSADPANPGLSTLFTRPFISQQGLTFTALEMSLISRFNPLAGAPVALAGVPGFSSGTTNSPFELQLRPNGTGQPKIIAGPLTAFVGSTVDFYAVDPAGSLTWDFGDGSNGSDPVTSHVYQTAGYYRAKLFSPSGSASPQDIVEILALPAPGRAPQRPVDLGGEPSGLPLGTASATYAAHVFQPFFTLAGVSPAHWVSGDPATAPDRYVTDVTPQTTFVEGETNEYGAAYVSVLPIQQMYAASMDMDLAPLTPASANQPFNSDGFLPLSSPGFDVSINVNNQGFKDEDFNYSHVDSLWRNTRTQDGSLEYGQDPQNGLIVWGNTLVTPNLNYSAQPFQARNGSDFTFARDDDAYHPHAGTTTFADLETHRVVTHYRLACSIGATILTVTLPPAAVKAAKPRRSQPDNPFDPELITAPPAVSRNLYFQLHTGFLGMQ
jgi:hypothetical protein